MINCENSFPTDIIFGNGSHNEIGERIRNYSSNILFVYGGGSIKRTGLYDEVVHSLEKNDITYHELGGIHANFTNTIHTDIVDGVAEGVMRGIIKNGLIAYQDPTNVDAWAELMIGADYSHNGMTGFGRETDWSNHGMEEVISGVYDCPHGAGLAVTTLAWMKYVYKRHIPI